MKRIDFKVSLPLVILVFACMVFVPFCSVNAESVAADALLLDNASSTEVFYDDRNIPAPQTFASRSIYYTSKSETSYKLQRDTPNYYNMGTITNSCACVAATVCVGYYDYTLTNLIPDFAPYFTIGGKLRPKGTGLAGVKDKVQGVINSMYDLMGTNSIAPGTSDPQFFSGFNQYVINRGYSFSKTAVASNGEINLSQLDTAFKQGKPVVLLCHKYNIIDDLTEDEKNGRMIVNQIDYTTPHIMVAYGYRQIRYFNGTDNFLTHTYLDVSSGMVGNLPGVYCCVTENTTQINDAFAITIS